MKLTKIFASIALLVSSLTINPAMARPDFPSYHGSKDVPFDWCGWFVEAGLSRPYAVFCK